MWTYLVNQESQEKSIWLKTPTRKKKKKTFWRQFSCIYLFFLNIFNRLAWLYDPFRKPSSFPRVSNSGLHPVIKQINIIFKKLIKICRYLWRESEMTCSRNFSHSAVQVNAAWRRMCGPLLPSCGRSPPVVAPWLSRSLDHSLDSPLISAALWRI